MVSGWFINDLELPEAPTKDDRNNNRTFQAETLFNFFAEFTKSTANSFDYKISGFVYPQTLVKELDELSKGADTDIVTLTIPVAQQLFEPGHYAIKTYRINRKGPSFIIIIDPITMLPVEVEAYPYEINFTEKPGVGESDTIILGDQTANEDAVGIESLPAIYDQLLVMGVVGNLDMDAIDTYNFMIQGVNQFQA